MFDALTMACVADELRATVLGGRVQAVLLPDARTIGLEIYSQKKRYYLLASAHSQWGRVHLAADKLRRGGEVESGLLLLLRKYARGAILSAVEQPPLERVLRLKLDHPEWGASELHVEVMGRHSNILLVGAGNRVLDAAKRVTPEMSPARPVLPGLAYQPPPAQARPSPAGLDGSRLGEILATAGSGPAWKALVAGLRGMSPLLAREVAHRALGDAAVPAAAAAGAAGRLAEVIAELLRPLERGKWQPSLALEDGRPVDYAPYWLSHRPGAVAAGSISRAIEQAVAALSVPAATERTVGPEMPAGLERGGADAYAAAKRPLAAAIARARERVKHRLAAVQRPLDQAAEAELWRRQGEWILAYAHTIRPRQPELVADTGEGEVLVIPLDPDKSPADNAQSYFSRYRKVRRAAEGGAERLEEGTLALRDLDQLETDLQLAASRPEIEAVRAALVEAGHLRTDGRPGPRAIPARPLAVPSPDGLTILVGRNSRQNDEVTFRRAAGDDWWFHARGVPGAHVVVCAEGRPLPGATIRRAAELAAHYSRLRSEPTVMVDYTRRRQVRRIPGAAPGLVTYTQEQTVQVAPRGPEE